MRAGEKDERKNWAQGAKEAACENCIILVMMEMHREYIFVGESTLPSSLRVNYKNCLKYWIWL